MKAKKENTKPHKVIDLFNKEPIDLESTTEKQSRLLRQLTHLLNEELDLNHFLTTMLESIHNGLACDQSFILLYKGKQRELLLKQHLGNESKHLAMTAMRLLKNEKSALSLALDKQQACWSEREILLQVKEHPDFPNHNLMISPINAMGKQLGFIFSVKTSSGNLNEQDYESFCHFSDHASIAFRIFINTRK